MQYNDGSGYGVKSYLAIAQTVESEFVGQVGARHGVRQILFVGKHENGGFSQLVFLQLKNMRPQSLSYR